METSTQATTPAILRSVARWHYAESDRFRMEKNRERADYHRAQGDSAWRKAESMEIAT